MRKSIFIFPIIIIGLVVTFILNSSFPRGFDYLSFQSLGQSTKSGEITPQPVVQEMINQVNQDRALTDLKRLTGVEPICIDGQCYTITGRETGSEGLRWAKAYVIQQLAALEYSVEIQDWKREGHSDQNLIVRIPGSTAPATEIYFIAHLDGYIDNNPAADDDASGVVSLLELARVLKNHFFSKSIVLFFSTGEENGALGASSYVNQLTREQLNNIQYVVAVEMLGYDSNNDGAMQFWSGDQPLDFVQLLSDILSVYHLKLFPQIVTGCA